MRAFLVCLIALVSVVLASPSKKVIQKQGSIVEGAAGKWGSPSYYPKYCYKNVCKDVETCHDVECNCVELDYVCGCNKEEEYYFKKYGYGGSSGSHDDSPYFYKKKVCIDYALCPYKKCETCHKCYTEKKCEKVKVYCYGGYHGH